MPETYYQEFTQYLLQTESNVTPTRAYAYSDWRKNPASIHSLKLVDLKNALKFADLSSSGNKRELLQRLLTEYQRILSAIKIQCTFRMFLARESERLRGPGHKEMYLCVNNTDFKTMDALSEISRESFFSYGDDGGFVYGFDIFSLMSMFKQTRRFTNPYNREDIPIGTVCRIFSLYKKIEILYPLAFAENRVDNSLKIVADHISGATEGSETSEVTYSDASSDDISADDDYNSPMIICQRYVAVCERIRQLLRGEMDSDWFMELTASQHNRFYHCYHIWWLGSLMSDDAKIELCGVVCPFETVPYSVLSQIDSEEDSTAKEYYQRITLELIEMVVYNGVNMTRQTTGARHVMSMLTMVSPQARRSCTEFFVPLIWS